MNRKQVLKEMKNKKKEKKVVEDENYVNRFITYLAMLLVILIAGYLIVGIFVTKSISFKKDKTEEEETEVIIDNTTILAGEIFDQKESEYYVLIYDVDDKSSIITNWFNAYKNKVDAIPVYVVDSKLKLNANFIVEKDSNTNPTGYSDLRIKNPTLIKVQDKTVTQYIEGDEEIKNIFKN